MDKRQLLEDIARIRKQIFAVISFGGFLLTALATGIGQGLDGYAIFQNSTLALLLFGVLGYVFGNIYERVVEKPLIESYREEARRLAEQLKASGMERVAMTIAIADLKKGMIVAEPVCDKSGSILLHAGTKITERSIKTLQDHQISSIQIEAQRQAASDEEIRREWGEE